VLRGDPGVMLPIRFRDLEDAVQEAEAIAEATGLPLVEKPTLPVPPLFWK